MQPPLHNRQNEPSASSAHDKHLLASASAAPVSSATRPPLRTSTSSPDPLTVPFEQLSLYDQDKLRHRQHQDRHIVHPSTHAPSNPFVGPVQEQEAQYVDESSMLRQRFGQGAKGKAPDPGYAPAVPSRPRPTSRTTTPAGPKPQRPDLPHRNSSFSKRHASFDSPREVPLPFMPNSHMHHVSYSQTSQHDVPPYPHVMGEGTELTAQAAPSVFHPYDPSPVVAVGGPVSAPDHYGPIPMSISSSGTGSSTSSSSSSQSPILHVDTPMDTGGGPSSNAIPNPYFANTVTGPSAPSSFLQMQSGSGKSAQVSPVPPFSRPFSTPDASSPMAPRIHSPHPVHAAGMPDRSSTASLPLPAHTPYHTLPSADVNVSSGSGLTSAPSSTSSFSRPPLPENHSSSSSSGMSIPTPPSSYSVSPAAQGALRIVGRGTRLSEPNDRAASPPLARFLERANATTAMPSGPASAFWEREVLRPRRDPPPPRISPESLPPPAPPQVLTPPPPPLSEEAESDGRIHRPYEPFLAHALPSNDAWIAVETLQREYRLLVRLPGFRRDAITLSTRKRRILHVVADSWEPNGGHFERRISFGYDADLAQVRAEFDGEYLRVIVPRRQVSVNFWSL